ncbi:MAG: YkgJ family cysteine cluster protein [Nitrospirae bacterium]|nr:YkgJ family cysteine cluster protein [Nitrospirota bacterium]
MKKSRKTEDAEIKRFHFSEDEARFAWLPLLLDGYEIIDRGIDIAIKREKRKTLRRSACREGCAVCCDSQADIPLYPLELAGIYWYAIEKITGQSRTVLAGQLAAHAGKPPCPFLMDNVCSIYPVRPAACRQFIVFTRPCSQGEDAYHTRREDVLTPLQDFVDRAFFVMLPFYGITREADRIQAVKNKVLNTRVRNLLEFDWKALAGKMEVIDFRS